MNILGNYMLKLNPFYTPPVQSPEEIIWAGFKDVRHKMEAHIKQAIRIPNSSLVLNWGEYGSGKTHAAKFFQKKDVLTDLSDGLSLPYHILICFPQGKEPVKELFIQVIDKLDIEDLRKKFRNKYTHEVFGQCTDNILIQNILRILFDETVAATQMKAYLYGNAQIKAEFIREGVQRKLESDSDYTEFLASLFSFLTYGKSVFSCVIFWIDEFENMALLNLANVSKMNKCVRTLIDKAPNNLLIFLNLTQSAMMDVDDLSAYLQEEILSRIKDRILLPTPGTMEVKEYLKDLLNNPTCRVGKPQNFTPFTEDVIDCIIKDLKGSAQLRKYNEVFSSILEHAMSDKINVIDSGYYQSVKSEVIG